VERDKTTGRYKVSEQAEMYLPGEYTITGTFSFDKYDFDKDIMFMGLDAGDSLFNLDYGSATHIYVWTADPFNMDRFTDKLTLSLYKVDPFLQIHTWKEMHSRILGVLAVEKNMQFFLLIFIVLVAAFSIANTLITTVIQKTREIGLLKAMGTSSAGVMRIFLLQGFFVGVAGSIGGVLLGWLVVVYRMNILAAMRFISGQEIFPKEVYLFRELPAHIIWSDVAIITLISILLCTCGALLPALRAASLDPAKALRYE
jgi:lipoprotein-releasing system permease protein